MSTNHLRAVSHITLAVTSSSLAETDVALWFASSKIFGHSVSLPKADLCTEGRGGNRLSLPRCDGRVRKEEEGGGCLAAPGSDNHGGSERGSAFTELPQMHGFNQLKQSNFSYCHCYEGCDWFCLVPRFSSSSVHHQHDPARARALSCLAVTSRQ